MSTPYDKIVDLLSTMSSADLKRLQLLVNDLVEHGYFPAEGSLEFRFITRSGKTYGPYKYRRRWHKGKLTDHYEGKATPDEYRDWLAHTGCRPPSPEPKR
ncbi:MAG: hypothetical protein ACYDAL_18665 [Candidatus Dormibacteraceae bacterium]